MCSIPSELNSLQISRGQSGTMFPLQAPVWRQTLLEATYYCGKYCYSLSMRGGRVATKHPIAHGTVPTTKDELAPCVTNTEVNKPCSVGIRVDGISWALLKNMHKNHRPEEKVPDVRCDRQVDSYKTRRNVLD